MAAHYKLTKKRLIKLVLLCLAVLIALIIDRCSDSKAGIIKSTSENYRAEGLYAVHFLDVGQGDCTLFETNDGKFALIDASTDDQSDKIISYLSQLGVERLEFVLFTHPDEDHIGGGDEILGSFEVEKVYMNSHERDSESSYSYELLLDSVAQSKKKHGTKVIRPTVNDTFNLGNIEFHIISDGKAYSDTNNSSLCFIAELGKSTFLFTGDAQKAVENDILNEGYNLSAEVFKSAHHGSSTSNSRDFLDEINPDIVIISCGRDNSYGHPHDEVLEDLNQRNAEILRTDEDGDIVLAFNEENIFIL